VTEGEEQAGEGYLQPTMIDSTATAAPRSRRNPRQALADVTNPATIKGTISVVAGLVLVLAPSASIVIVEIVAGVSLLLSGLYDLWHALTGRGSRKRGSRWLALGRGLAGVLVGFFLLLARQETVDLVLAVLTVYLAIRGLLTLGFAVLTRDRSRRTARLTIGSAGLAVSVLMFAVPGSLAKGIIVAGAGLALVTGGILLAYGLRVGAPAASPVDVQSASVAEMLWDWVRTSDIGSDRREQLADTLYFEDPDRASKLTAWWVMLMLSVGIATFAVLQDSTAVVIGAMLIAPLMTPILGLAGAIVNGWRHRAGASTLLVTLGVLGAVGLAYLISSWVPALVSFEANTQITSRVDPTFVDMLIALAAGAAGAFATVNTRVASSIAGVAIAVALVPPLGVVGASLEQQRWEDAFGSFLLFATNFVSIVLAAAAVFVLSGFAEGASLRSERRQVVSTLAPFAALAMLILVPLVFTAEGILVTATQQKSAQDVVADWVGDESGLRIDQVSVSGDVVTVAIAGAEVVPPPRQLQQDLSKALELPVEVVIDFTPRAEINVSQEGTVERRNAANDGG
jgi:uncharacterized hydrophobic protein (TIGR00271 family)